MSTYTLEIETITCNTYSDAYGSNDEVWLFVQPDAGVPVRYPFAVLKTNSMTDKQVWTLGTDDWPPLICSFEYDLQITLWDQDRDLRIDRTDFLANFNFDPDSNDSISMTAGNGNSSSYSIKWKKTSWG